MAEEVAPVAIGGPAERDEFVAWHGKGRRVSDEEFAPKELLDGSVAEVVAILERGETGRDAFRGFVLLQPVKAVSALRRLASRDRWPAAIWQGFFWTASALRERLKSEPRFQDYVARVLAAAPNELFATVGSAAGGFVKDLAENYGLDREQELQVLWNKAWTGIGQCEPEVLGLDDPLTDALNHLAGKLAEAALIRLWKHEPGVGTGLPALVRPYFDAIGVDPNGQLGRVMLATRLYHLYAIDPDWVRDHMIARLNPARSEEAVALWSAYGWSPTVGPDLVRAFKEPFLEVLCDGAEGGQTEERLASLFMAICLEGPSELSEDEIHRVIGSMSEAALITVLDSLKGRLTGGPDPAGAGLAREGGPMAPEILASRCGSEHVGHVGADAGTCSWNAAMRFRMRPHGRWSICDRWTGTASIASVRTGRHSNIRIGCCGFLIEWWMRRPAGSPTAYAWPDSRWVARRE